MPSEVAWSREPTDFSLATLMRRSDGYNKKCCACGKRSGRAVGSGAASFPRRGRDLTRLVATGRGMSRPGATRRATSQQQNLCRAFMSSARKKRAGKELAVFILVEPRAFDIEELDAGEAGK